jgi:hypothetical protein
MALGLRVENEWGGRVNSKKRGGGEVVKVKWEVVCLGREKERERGGRPAGREGEGRGEEKSVWEGKRLITGVPRSVDLRS